MELDALLTVVGQVGFPIFVGVWGIWFLTFRVWPDHVNIQMAQSQAMLALAAAIESLPHGRVWDPKTIE